MRMKPPNSFRELIFTGVLLLVIIGINADGCTKGCPRSDTGKLKYSPGIGYQYNFDSYITIGVQNAQSEETGMKLKGDAILYYDGNCDYTLKLDNVDVQTTLEKLRKEIKTNFNKPIKFKMIDGELESQICSESDDNEYSLNIKRAIISMLQYTDNKYETDVFGVCPTETTTSTTNDGTKIITKIRNLMSCNYRENLIAFYANGIVNENSNIKSRPILNGDYVKEQKLLNGIYQNIELIETYQSQHKSNKGNSLLWVKVKTNLKLLSQNPTSTPQLNDNLKKSKSIIFNHPNNLGIQNYDVLKKVFDETVNLVGDYAKANSAQHFSELIRLMRNANVNTLIELSAVHNDLAKKVYFDALIRTNTVESVKAIVKQIGKWNNVEQKLALMSLALVHSIDLEGLNSVANLLTPDAGREAYLSIGTLVNTYCRENSCNKGEVDLITQKYSQSLRNCNARTKKDEDHIVSVLKGIRNSQHIADTITSQLIECASSKNSARIRVAALQSYTASICNKQLQQYAMQLLHDLNEDSEIRIESYLAVVQCPNGDIANELSDIINNEKINQVGGFITSHLKAIRDSTDFTKSTLKHHLGNIRITKKFPIDPRRFSFNNEFSYAIDTLGIGASIDSNVIYSQKGFLPRSLRLNITNEAFGTSFNTFEFNMRQENLEKVLEHFFGPKGFFSQEPQIILNQMDNYIGNKNGHRSKRNIIDDSNNMASKYKTYGNDDMKFLNDINLDLSMKIFGSELTFLSLGNHIPSNVDELSILLKTIVNNFKNGLKNFEHKYEYHTLLQDFEIVYPTGIGLPLEIAVKSSTTGKLDFGIELDMDQLIENYKNGKYRLKLIPSQDVNFETFLRIDSGVLSTGLRTSSNLHSADGGDIILDLLNNENGFNIDLKLPRQNVELIEFKHNIDFFISEQDKELKILPFKQNKKRKTYQPVCFDQLKLFGLTVCYTANVPSDTDLNVIHNNDNIDNKTPFLLNGPMQMSLILHTEKHIQLQGRYKTNTEYQNWQLIYDTPGSSESHKTELQLKLGVQPKLFARIDFINPQKQLAGEGGLINNDKEFLIYGQFEIDNDKNVQKIGFTKNGNVYQPLIQFIQGNQIRNDLAGYKADGRIIVDTMPNNIEKYNFDNFRIITPENKETVINGWLENYGQLKGFNTELTIRKPDNKLYKIDSHFKRETPTGLSIGTYVTEDNNPDSTIGGSLLLEYDRLNLKHELKLQTGKHYLKLHNALETIGDNPEESTYRFLNDLEIKNNKETTPIISGKLNGDISKKIINFDFEATRLNKIISMNLKMSRNQRNIGDFDLDIKSKLNRHFIDLKSKIDVRQGKYNIDTQLITSWGTQGNIKGEINQNIQSQNALIDLNGQLKLNNNDKDNIFILKYTDLQDKINGEFKLKRDNIDLIIYNGEITNLPDKQNGNIKLIVKDNLNLNGKFNLNKNGRGDFSGTIHLKKAGKPIKINSKFLYALPKFNLDTTIQFDDKKIIYKTENELYKTNKFNTKNHLEIGTEKFEFNAGLKTDDDNNDINGEFLLILPTERKFNGELKRQFNNKNGNIKFELNDIQPNGKKRSIQLNGIIKDYDRFKNYYNVDYNIQYINFDDKNLQLLLNSKYLPKNQNDDNQLTADINIDLSGQLLTETIKFNLNLVELSKEHCIYRITNSYGQKFMSNINGNYYIKNINNNDFDKTGTYEIQLNINIPETELKQISLTSNGKYLINDQQQQQNDINNILRELEFNLNYKLTGLNKNGDYHVSVKGTNKHGQYNIQCSCPKTGKNEITGTWNRDLINVKANNNNNDIKSGKIEHITHINIEQLGKADIKMLFDFIENDQVNLHYTLQTSYDKLKNLDFILKAKQTNENIYTSLVKVNLNQEQYIMNLITYTGLIKMGIDLQLQTPTKQTKILSIYEKYQDHHIKGNIQIDNLFDFDLIHTFELKFESPDDFYIIGELNSNKLKLYKIKGNINGKNKNIQINIQSNDQVYIDGNAQYNVKTEKNKIIIEGQGQIQYKNDKNSASFQLTRQLFDLDINNEIGFEYIFNGQLGRKNIVSTLKLTNKNFIIKLTGCEESKQCTNFVIQSIITVQQNDLTNIVHELQILINLLELGYPYEFDLQSKSTKLGLKINHEIDITIKSNNNKQYKFIANIKPDNNLIQFILPKRIISFETINKIPNNGIFGKYENSITFHFDKLNRPDEKAIILAIGDLTGLKSQLINVNFEIKFDNPYIQRPLLMKGYATVDKQNKKANANIIFDIFKSEELKIIGDAKVHNNILDKELMYLAEAKFYSTGLGFNYKAKTNLKINYEQEDILMEALADGGGDLKFSSKLNGNKDKFDIQLIVLNQQLFNMKGVYDGQKNLFKTDSTYQIIGSKPIKLITELLPLKLKVILKRDGLLVANGEFNAGKEASLRLIKGSDNKQIYNAKLSLDPSNFLTTQYDVNKDELNDFMKLAEEELVRDTDIAKQKLHDKFTKASTAVTERLKKAKENLPDVTKLVNNYQNNVKSIINELEEDPSLKKLFTEVRVLYEKIVAILQDLLTKTTELYKKIEIAFLEFYEKQQQLFNETILPALKDLNQKINDILTEFYSELMKVIRQVFERANKAWKTFENDIKELSKPIIELLKPIGDFITELIKVITKEWNELWDDIKEYFNKLPTVIKELTDKLNEQLIKLRNIDEIINILHDIFQQLETYTTSNEIKDFLNKLLNYIEAKLLNKSINDVEELEGLYYSLLQVINSIILQLTGDNINDGYNLTTTGAKSYYNLIIQPISYGLDTISKLPSWLSFKFSPFNYLRNEKFNTFSDLLIYNLPSTLDFLPPYQLNGHISDGQNIFTFDGRYILFPGSCKYILAQDSIDNNFTIIGNIINGKMESIILIDKSNNYIEVNNNGIIKLNDKKTEYPIHDKDIHAWRRYYTISLLSSYGVLVKCTVDLRVCHININGFYTGKIRGLFGNGNAEPYDDFIKPNGEIIQNSNDFCNSYNVNNCAPVQNNLNINLNNNDQLCNELFDIDSTLLFGYLFIDRKPYRDACNTVIQLKSNQNDKEDSACNIALTYASAARLYNNIPVNIPKRCIKCNDINPIINIDDQLTIKVPQQKADIILIFDSQLNDDIINDLIQPILNKLRSELKQRNLNDINIAVIGYNNKQKYPNLLTTNGKLNYNGKLLESTLTGPKYDDISDIGINKLNEFLEKLKEIHTPIESDYKAIELALDYPFRPDSAKSILLIRDDETQLKVMDFISTPILNFLLKTKGVSVNYVGPVNELTVDGKPNEKVVGFNKRAIAMLGGVNKRQKLDYSNNPFIDTLVNDDSWIFSLNNYKQLKTPDQKKQFTQQVSSMVADQLYKTEITSSCQCSLKYGLHGETQCTKQSYEYLPTKKNIPQKQG